MLNFLNRAQSLADAFYPNGSTQPQLTYILRPKLDPSFKDAIVQFEVDGQMHAWNSSLQKQFTWPAPPGSKELGVKGSIRMGSVVLPVYFARRSLGHLSGHGRRRTQSALEQDRRMERDSRR